MPAHLLRLERAPFDIAFFTELPALQIIQGTSMGLQASSVALILSLYIVQIVDSRELRGQSPLQIQRSIVNYLKHEIQQGHIVGAQVFITGTRSATTNPVNLGSLGPDRSNRVSDETVFCIASCSKPIASAVVFTLLDFPLIGGSLYSNVTDLNRFTTMVLQKGRIENNQVLSAKAASHFISVAHPDQAYGYGWRLTKRGNPVTITQHKGFLPPYQSAIQIDFENDVSKLVLWTLSDPKNVAATKRINNQIDHLFRGGFRK